MTETNHPNRLASWLEAAWLERYLDRQLDAEEVAWFETYALDKPDLLQRIDADSDLRDGLMSSESDLVAHGKNTTDNLVELHAVAARKPLVRRRYGLYMSALAASLLAWLGVGWMMQRGSTQQQLPTVNPTNPEKKTVVWDYGPTRGEGGFVCIEQGTDLLHIEVNRAVPPAAEHIRVLSPELKKLDEGFVHFEFPAAVRLEFFLNGRRREVDIDLAEAIKKGKPCPHP